MKAGHIAILGPVGTFEIDGEEFFGVEQAQVMADVAMLPPDTDTLYVWIAGPGGVAESAQQIYDYLVSLKPKMKIITCQVDDIASADVQIFLAGDERNYMPGKKFLIHNPWRETSGDAAVHAAAAISLKKREDNMAAFYSSITGFPVANLLALMSAETDISKQVVQFKFATGEVNSEEAQTKAIYNMKLKEGKTIEQWATELAARFKKRTKNKDVAMVLLNVKGGAKLAVNAADPTKLEQSPAFTVGTDGNPTTVPAPDGPVTLEDGRTLTIDDGMVTAVSQAQPVAAPMPAAALMSALKVIQASTKSEAEKDAAILALLTVATPKDTEDEEEAELTPREKVLMAQMEAMEAELDEDEEIDLEERLEKKLEAKIKEFKSEIKTKHKPKVKAFERPADRVSPAQAYLENK